MSEKGSYVVPFAAQITSAHSYNTPICFVKLYGPKTYLIWSRQCTISFQSRGHMGYAARDKKRPETDDPNSEQWIQ